MKRRIELLKLNIVNFKSIKGLIIDFGKLTSIYGRNGIGKTTIQDASSFLLFDKDSKDSSKFIVQPLGKDSKPIHNLETSIEAVFDVDGKELTLKRTYKEKYSKVRGTSRVDFKGYESNYYVNDVPQKVNEYKKFVNDLIDENIFKLITNPLYFSQMLHWKERREIINQIAGDLDNLAVIDSDKKLETLRQHLTEHSVNDFMKIVKSKVRKLKEDREKLPVRIDEAEKQIKEFEFEALGVQKVAVIEAIKDIDEKIQDKSKSSEELSNLKILLANKKSDLCELEFKNRSKINEPVDKLENEIRRLEADFKHLGYVLAENKNSLDFKKDRLCKLNDKRNDLLNEYKSIKDLKFEFDENACTCPTCKRKFEADDIEAKRKELEENFNSDKAKKLTKNMTVGKATKAEIDEFKNSISNLESDIAHTIKNIESYKSKLENLKKELEETKSNPTEPTEKEINLKNEIVKLEEKIKNFKSEDLTELKDKKEELQERISEIDSKLAFKENNKQVLQRMDKLKNEESKLSEKIAELEGLEILTEEFIRTKVELLEENINSKFKYVKFKMFREQVNGGLEECCEPCVDGIPFESNLNTAAKINAGLDIINTLCAHYNVSAPIFVDNAESVNNLIDTDSQVIRLVVSEDKELKVEVD